MRRLHGAMVRLASHGAVAGGALIVLAALVVSGEVLIRKLLGLSIGGADEISGYLFAIGTAWSFAYVIVERGNVRVDALYALLPSGGRALLDILGALALLLVLATVTWRAFFVVRESLHNNAHAVTPLQTPLALPQGLWFVGLVGATALLSLVLALAIGALARGRRQEMAALIGDRGADAALPSKDRKP